MQVRFLNLVKLYEEHRLEYEEAILRNLEKGAMIGGAPVQHFEKTFAAWVGPDITAAGCASGTDAITLAALSLNLPKGSTAVIPAMTFMATAEALLHAGFKIHLVDVEESTGLLEPKHLKELPSDTSLIVPVHLYGQMAQMDLIRKIADEKGYKILEDAAQAHGATWKGKSAGHFGDIATFSFYPGKNLGAFGDAGAVVSRYSDYITTCRKLGNHGGIEKYVHDLNGFCSRLDAIQAAVLSVKLKYIDEWNEKRRAVAHYYQESLGKIPGLNLPVENENAKSVYHLYVIRVEEREKLMNHLKAKGIESAIHYPRAIHELKPYQEIFKGMAYPQAETWARQCLSLPMCPTLQLEELEYVSKTIKEYFHGR